MPRIRKAPKAEVKSTGWFNIDEYAEILARGVGPRMFSIQAQNHFWIYPESGNFIIDDLEREPNA